MGLTDKVFGFKPLKAVNIKPQLPVAYHIFWPPFVAQTTPHMGLRGTQPAVLLVWHSGRSLSGSSQTDTEKIKKHKKELPSSSGFMAECAGQNYSTRMSQPCQVNTTFGPTWGHQSSWSFSSLPLLTLMTACPQKNTVFDLWRSDCVTQTMFAACIYSSSAVAGATSEGTAWE